MYLDPEHCLMVISHLSLLQSTGVLVPPLATTWQTCIHLTLSSKLEFDHPWESSFLTKFINWRVGWMKTERVLSIPADLVSTLPPPQPYLVQPANSSPSDTHHITHNTVYPHISGTMSRTLEHLHIYHYTWNQTRNLDPTWHLISALNQLFYHTPL